MTAAARRRVLDGAPHTIAFRFQHPTLPDLPVELYGDFVHWFAPHALQQGGDGWVSTLALPPGVYAYKFRTFDGRWHLDRDNPRTRERSPGQRNNVLTLGGSDEPILHAPHAPYAFRLPDGRIRLRAALRRGHGDHLRMRTFDEASTPTDIALSRLPWADEAEHLLFQVDLPLPARHLDYLFILDDGRWVGATDGPHGLGGPTRGLRLHGDDLPPLPPTWWQHAVVYSIFVDRFRNSAQPSRAALLATGERSRFGGDLEGIRQALPYLQDLGVTVLHLTPLATSDSAHRYDAKNPMCVDPALGGEAALRKLLDDAHARGLRVIGDLVHTHVHRDFLPFCDVRARGHASPFASWFHLLRHPFFDGGEGEHGAPDPGYAHYQKGQWQEPLLRHEHPEVIDYLCRVLQHQLALGFDGLRIDAASDAPRSLLGRLRQAAGPHALLLGEVTTDNIARFIDAGLHAATDFAHGRALCEWLAPTPAVGGDAPSQPTAADTARAWAQADVARGAPSCALHFTATHDQPRFLTRCRDPQRTALAHLITLLSAGVPAIYYGDEIGLCAPPDPAQHAAQRDFDDAWPDRAPFPWPSTDRWLDSDGSTPAGDPANAPDHPAWDRALHRLFRDLLRLRRDLPALHAGQQEILDLPIATAADVLALRRIQGEQVVEIYVRRAEHDAPPADLPLPTDAPRAATLLYALGDATLRGDPPDGADPRLSLGPLSAAVLLRHVTPPTQTMWDELVQTNRACIDAAFRHGARQALTLPAHLYVTVTERCNLRCQHCITDAPARTQDGRARTLQPWLIDALRPAFAAADYVAFVHGGESLVAPIFFDVLQAIQRARQGRPCDIHLLSNGMLLTSATIDRLIDHGVTSLSISLDGGSAATNDTLRVGARFDTLWTHIADAVIRREARAADLRIGVSTVLTTHNRDELPALAARLSALGVDWFKVEEMCPTNLIAAQSLIEPRDRRVAPVLAQIYAAAGRMRIVDHLTPPPGCPCASRPDDAAGRLRRQADDFANRARFRSCRADWDQACIDPDGTVHPVDYMQPAIGNLARESLLSIWHGPAMQTRRAHAIAGLSPALRESCPHT